MNAIVEAKPQEIAPALEQPQSLLAVIERAARDPNIDIDKMERLLQMQERITTRAAEAEFNRSMSAAQADMRPVAADADNPQTRSKYASYAALDRALRPIYTKHGFAISYDEAESPKPEHVRVLAYVSHASGFTRTYHADMPADGKGAKGGDVMTKTHAVGAAKSYGMRYLLRGIFNIAVGEEDTDGNEPTGADCITAGQAADLNAMLTEYKIPAGPFLKWAKVERLEQIRAANFIECVRAIRERGKARR